MVPSPRPVDAARLAIPPLFVVLWATGFVTARLVAPHAEPLTFLSLRFGLASAVLAIVALVMRAPWPAGRAAWSDAFLAGLLMHGISLCAVFWAVRHGLPAGIAALVSGLQPLLAAGLAGPALGERVGPRRWLGVAFGSLGVALVVGGRLDGALAYPSLPLAVCFAGTVSLTFGMLWQKRKGSRADLRTGTCVQYLGALAVALPLAALTETGEFDASAPAVIGLAWAVLGLSIGAVALLLILIRRGAVAAVASLMFLVPPVSALMGYWLFDERLGWVQVAGMAIAALGVAIASREPAV